MTEGTVETPRVSRRKIIERPRLTRLLDESPARIKMLIAPAGYGKTTLARQWLSTKPQSAWCVCRQQSHDVASLTATIAFGMNGVLPGAGERALHHVRSVEDAGRDVDTVAELIVEDALGWPEDSWLVIDDYQEIAGVTAAELLLANLAESSALPLLVCSRERPSWATARRILYQEIQEVPRDSLALTPIEIDAVLGARGTSAGTIERSSGWPALIGLAALTRNVPESHIELPEMLYEFLADEVFRELPETFRDQLQELAILPVFTAELLADVFNPTIGSTILEDGSRLGIITVGTDGETHEIHPLFRDYLLNKPYSGRDETHDFRLRLIAILSARRNWDEALAVAGVLDDDAVARVMEQALDDLLRAGRIETLKAWSRERLAQKAQAPIDVLVNAELCFRQGYYGEAQHLALAAAEAGADDVRARALLVAGRSAHLGSREEDALRLCRLAHDSTTSPALREQALWGELSAAVDLELPQAAELLEQLSGRRSDFAHTVNVVTKRMMLESRLGRIGDLDPARAVERRVDGVPDPLVRCSFRNTLINVLALRGEYEECLAIAERLEFDAARSRLEFVVPYVQANKVMALAGLRRDGEALELHAAAYDASLRLRDDHSRLNLEAILARLHFSFARFDEAAQALPSHLDGAIRSMHGEYLATRALVSATAGNVRDGESLATEARKISHSAEPVVLSAGAFAIAAVRSGSPSAPDLVKELLDVAVASGNLDCLLTIYRGCPEIIDAITDSTSGRQLREIMVRHGDAELAKTLQALLTQKLELHSTLSKREREVADLIRRGMSNADIAAELYISPATAKVHVHNILGKLGVRTRVEAALRLAAEKAHATSVTRASGPSSTSARDSRENAGAEPIR